MQELEIIFNDQDLGRLPKGCNNNKPLFRKQRIVSSIKDYMKEHNFHDEEEEEEEEEEEKRRITRKTMKLTITSEKSKIQNAKIVHCENYLNFLSTAYKEWRKHGKLRCPEFFYEQEKTFQQNNDERIECEEEEAFVPAQIAPRVDKLQRYTSNIHSQICYFALDRNTPIFHDTYEQLECDLQVIELAVEKLKTKTANRIYALTTHPGHHAGKDWFGGYCYLNVSAYCSLLLEPFYSKVAHIDIDYHAGNGTMSVLWENPNIFFASIHCDPTFDYPYTSGFKDQVGGGEAIGKTLNIPLPPKTKIDQYLESLRTIKEEVIKHGAEVLVVSLGVDTLDGDFDASPDSGFSIQLNEFSLIGDEIKSFHLPTIFVQEGGYVMSSVGEAILRVLLGSSYSSSSSSPSSLSSSPSSSSPLSLSLSSFDSER